MQVIVKWIRVPAIRIISNWSSVILKSDSTFGKCMKYWLKNNIRTIVIWELPLKSVVFTILVCEKPLEKVSWILVTLTSHSNSPFKRSSVSFNVSKLNYVAFRSNSLNYSIRKSGRLECENFCVFQQTDLWCTPSLEHLLLKFLKLSSKLFGSRVFISAFE